MKGKMDCHGLSDIGQARETNEDQFLISELNKSMRIHQVAAETASVLEQSAEGNDPFADTAPPSGPNEAEISKSPI